MGDYSQLRSAELLINDGKPYSDTMVSHDWQLIDDDAPGALEDIYLFFDENGPTHQQDTAVAHCGTWQVPAFGHPPATRTHHQMSEQLSGPSSRNPVSDEYLKAISFMHDFTTFGKTRSHKKRNEGSFGSCTSPIMDRWLKSTDGPLDRYFMDSQSPQTRLKLKSYPPKKATPRR